MVAVTVPLPSGPVTARGCRGEGSPGPAMVAVTSSQVCPGTVEGGSGYGPLVPPYCPGSGRYTPKPSRIVVPFGDLPGMKPLPVIVTVWPPVTLAGELLTISCP